MSQLHPGVTQNLREFADYMKKSLILALIVVLGGVITIIAIFSISLGLLAILALAIFGGAIGLLVFQIMQLIRLSRAKSICADYLLSQGYNFFLGALIVSGISIVLSFGELPYLIDLILDLGTTVLTLLSYNALVKFAENNYSSAQKARQGFNLYLIASGISIGLSLISLLGIFGYSGAILFLVVSLIVSIVAIVGQFMLANGFLEAFVGGSSHQSSTSSWNDPTEPTFQSYGTTTSGPQTWYSNTSIPSPVSSENREQKYCKMCGTPLLEGTKFCGNCGSTQ